MESLPHALRWSQGNLSFLKVFGFHIRIFGIELLKFIVSTCLNVACEYVEKTRGALKTWGGSGSISKYFGRSLDFSIELGRNVKLSNDFGSCKIFHGSYASVSDLRRGFFEFPQLMHTFLKAGLP